MRLKQIKTLVPRQKKKERNLCWSSWKIKAYTCFSNVVLKGKCPGTDILLVVFFCLWKLMVPHLKLIWQVFLKILRKIISTIMAAPPHKQTLLRNTHIKEKHFRFFLKELRHYNQNNLCLPQILAKTQPIHWTYHLSTYRKLFFLSHK